MTLDEALNPEISLDDINSGKVNFWQLSKHQIDLAVLAEILNGDLGLREELKEQFN